MTAPKRIFIVEDQRLIAADLENTLKKLGYKVVGSVSSGEEALQKTLDARPDLVLMDIRLRGEMDGITAAEAIRRRLDVPIVYLTAYADEETIARAKGTTPFGYVVKPFNERELRATLEIALYKHETDRLLAEERARRQAAEEYHERLEENARERERLVTELKEAVRARDEFLQIASHELKTPLTPLQLQLDTLARALEKAGIQNERLSKKLEMALRQARRLNRLVESLLYVARITGGHLVLQSEDEDLSALVRDAAERFRGEAQAAGCALTVKADHPVLGRWDRQRLEQVLSNLLSNAIKYGAGHPIEVAVREENGQVQFVVRDHGIGIGPEALERIFARFERAVSVRHYGGLGLGLFIARQICEAHGGTLMVESQPGIGSTFTARLPRQPIVPPSAAPDRWKQ
ncbi:MAG TPA: ATP-binding protein [Polyangia bacterium]|jgi:signal transduction histidine kinase|nr:ATP-binding protein [Polyangia bacterium]